MAGIDEKSDVFSQRMKLLGAVDYGTASGWFQYTNVPRYRAVSFQGTGGDHVDVWVRSYDGGDAVAWLVDNQFHVIAANDDADVTTYDAHISTTLPPGPKAKRYVIVRDYDLLSASFIVQLQGGPSGATCTLDSDCDGIALADGKVPQCNNDTHLCERVAIEDIQCEGFLPPNIHRCPTGYACVHEPLTMDAPGICQVL